MPMPGKSCAKCGGRMEEGRIVTKDSNAVRLLVGWVAGVPQRSIWTGLKLRNEQIKPIATYRCGRCGLLEDYVE